MALSVSERLGRNQVEAVAVAQVRDNAGLKADGCNCSIYLPSLIETTFLHFYLIIKHDQSIIDKLHQII